MYILDEMGATNSSIDVYKSHINALNNTNYVYDLPSRELYFPARPPLFGGSKLNVCQLCHIAEANSQAVNGAHTKLTIRVCTDEDCHGNSTTRGVQLPTYAHAGYVGLNLSSSNDAHSGWFNALEQRPSRYDNEDGGKYSQGFYACLGCHTHMGVGFNITRPNSYSLNLTTNVSGWTVTDVWVNESSTNQSYSNPVFGSKWR
jgi:hypothetical protein